MFGLNTAEEFQPPPINKAPIHTRRIFAPQEFRNIAEWATKEVNALRPDALVATGQSGLLLAGALSVSTGTPVFAVRKPNEYTVSNSDEVSGITSHGKSKRWLFVDDFICSGSTFRRCAELTWKAGLVEEPFPVACLLYGEWKNTAGPVSQTQIERIAEALKHYKGSVPKSIKIIGYLT